MSACCEDGTCVLHAKTFVELMEQLGAKEMVVGGHSVVATNGQLGGWVQQKDGTLISVEAAKEMNRAQRRKRGIKLHQ